TVQCWSESLAYDCALMNVALNSGNEKVLRDLFAASDMYRDAQGYVLAYQNAYRVGEAIAKDGNDIYLRAKNAALESINIVEEGARGKLELSRFETKALADAKAAFEALTDDADKFMSDNLDKYKKEVKVFLPENYGL
ncbi:MAG TPA: methanol--corrinoid methyltransferase, partial [Methanosarcina sp.]|nr:methanol--corrinoid methyltransferase [Methanosarcina sp.]